MDDEIYETNIGIFRMIADLEEANLVQVKILVPSKTGSNSTDWENVGIMKRKEFFKMIKPHNPKKQLISNANLQRSIWGLYSQI